MKTCESRFSKDEGFHHYCSTHTARVQSQLTTFDFSHVQFYCIPMENTSIPGETTAAPGCGERFTFDLWISLGKVRL